MVVMNNESFEEFNIFNKNNSFVSFTKIFSVRETFDSFCIYLDSLNKRPRIIVLTEIWISESELTSFS